MSAEHQLAVSDLGEGRAHRYQPACSCGAWSERPKRRERHCRIAHDEHLRQLRAAEVASHARPAPVSQPTPRAAETAVQPGSPELDDDDEED